MGRARIEDSESDAPAVEDSSDDMDDFMEEEEAESSEVDALFLFFLRVSCSCRGWTRAAFETCFAA